MHEDCIVPYTSSDNPLHVNRRDGTGRNYLHYLLSLLVGRYGLGWCDLLALYLCLLPVFVYIITSVSLRRQNDRHLQTTAQWRIKPMDF